MDGLGFCGGGLAVAGDQGKRAAASLVLNLDRPAPDRLEQAVAREGVLEDPLAPKVFGPGVLRDGRRDFPGATAWTLLGHGLILTDAGWIFQ